MESTGLTNGDLASLSLLNGGGRNGGIGVGGHDYPYGDTRERQDGTVANAKADCLKGSVETQNQFTRDVIREQSVDAKLVALQVQIAGSAAVAARDAADARAEAIKCCCETQALIASNSAATDRLILEQRIVDTQTQAAAAQNAALLEAIGNIGNGKGNNGNG